MMTFFFFFIGRRREIRVLSSYFQGSINLARLEAVVVAFWFVGLLSSGGT